MQQLAAEKSVAAILPGTEPALAALAGRDLGVPTGAPSPAAVARATDKDELGKLAEESGLASPLSLRMALPSTDVPDVTLPAIVKPARSTVAEGGRTIDLPAAAKVEDPAELAEVLANSPPGEYLVQPFLQGSLGATGVVARTDHAAGRGSGFGRPGSTQRERNGYEA